MHLYTCPCSLGTWSTHEHETRTRKLERPLGFCQFLATMPESREHWQTSQPGPKAMSATQNIYDAPACSEAYAARRRSRIGTGAQEGNRPITFDGDVCQFTFGARL